jgi:hypothetical protein
MAVLIDGHNALHRLGILSGDHEGDRRELVIRVREIDPRAVIYFDARNAPAGLPEVTREVGVRVRYVRETEADEAILERVREQGGGVVVSDDLELLRRARQLHARTRTVADFFDEAGDEPAPEVKPEEGAGGMRPEDFGLPRHVNLDHPPSDLREP